MTYDDRWVTISMPSQLQFCFWLNSMILWPTIYYSWVRGGEAYLSWYVFKDLFLKRVKQWWLNWKMPLCPGRMHYSGNSVHIVAIVLKVGCMENYSSSRTDKLNTLQSSNISFRVHWRSFPRTLPSVFCTGLMLWALFLFNDISSSWGNSQESLLDTWVLKPTQRNWGVEEHPSHTMRHSTSLLENYFK